MLLHAFLHGELNEEEIYIEQPEMFHNGRNEVCLLKRALYGLKQSSRVWNKQLDAALKQFGLMRSKLDPCIYYKIDGDKMLYISVYVDDELVFTNCVAWKNSLKAFLMSKFQIKDLGPAQLCLGLNITRDRNKGKIWIDQQKYIVETLEKFKMKDCNPVKAPADPHQKLTKSMSPTTEDEEQKMRDVPYLEAVGRLVFISQTTRPDITYAVHNVARFNSNPGVPHWNAVKRIFRYLKGSINCKLEYSKDEMLQIHGYSDSDWAGDEDTRRSTTGYVFFMQHGPISWATKRQATVALSSTEAEYMAVTAACQEALWWRQFQAELQPQLSHVPTTIKIDNCGAQLLATNAAYHSRTKHIDVRYHFIREQLEAKQITLEHVSSQEMKADSLTKPIPNGSRMVSQFNLMPL